MSAPGTKWAWGDYGDQRITVDYPAGTWGPRGSFDLTIRWPDPEERAAAVRLAEAICDAMNAAPTPKENQP